MSSNNEHERNEDDSMPRHHEPDAHPEIGEHPPVRDVVDQDRDRAPDRDQRTRLRALDGHTVTLTSTEYTEDADGIPNSLGQRVDRGMLHIPQATRDYWELDDDSTSDGTDAA